MKGLSDRQLGRAFAWTSSLDSARGDRSKSLLQPLEVTQQPRRLPISQPPRLVGGIRFRFYLVQCHSLDNLHGSFKHRQI
jgi:hypothetical protein